jgi:hypothetical protein
MPYRKLAGYTKDGKVWVNPKLPVTVQMNIRRHNREYQRQRENDVCHTIAIQRARRVEHRGMSPKQIQVYEGKVGALTKELRGRMSYSPIRRR